MSEIDCGDNSCLFAKNKVGMRTNGGCSCFENAGFSRSQVRSAQQMLPEILLLRSKLSQAMDTIERYEKALRFYATAPCADELLEIAPRFREIAREALNPKEKE